VRRRVYLLVALQILVPLTLLVIRVASPELGQLRFGWQMHTSCWGQDPSCSPP
jgi:hypothetical protein